MEDERRRLLMDLVALRGSPPVLEEALRPYGWDSDEAVSVTQEDVLSVLRRAQRGDISLTELRAWAECIEMRDDLDAEEPMRMAAFELANPELQDEAPVRTIERWIERLSLAR